MAADAAMVLEVPAGKSRTVRLRNLPSATALAVQVVSSGRLLVALVGEKQLRSPKPGKSGALFRAVVERSLSFKVVIPERGNYLLVLSNRGGSKALKVRTRIHALPPARQPTV